MTDVTMRRIDELDGHEGMFLYAAKALGVTAWGMNVLRLPADWDDYPVHDHQEGRQEEVYVALSGNATLEAGGERWCLEPGTLVRVGPAQQRRIVPGPDGVTLLAIGGTPGEPFKPRI